MVRFARALAWTLITVALSAAVAGCGEQAHAGLRPRASGPAPTHCFGAAARALEHPCVDSALDLTVYPSPAVAAVTPNAPCTTTRREGPIFVCSFGAPAAGARRSIALIGDSHAAMWRAAISHVASEHGWHGISITHAGCPLSTLTRQIGGPSRDEACSRWRQAVIPWLRQHPEISVLFVSGLSNSPFIRPAGQPNFAAAVAGFQKIWREVPATVKHIIVIRDTPRFGDHNLLCIRRAIEAHQDAGTVCAVERSVALPVDPEADAAERLHSPRVQVIDADREMCDEQRCYPVIGGALVLKDRTHLTRAFAATLAPDALAQVNALARKWTPAG